MTERNDDFRHDPSDDSPDAIESRIHSTQRHLRDDIDALEQKVSPENLSREARERVDETTDRIKEKAVESTRQAGEAVRHRIDDMTEGFRSGERMSSLSLLGLVAVIGVGLLLTRGSRSHDRYEHDRRPRPYDGPRAGMMDHDEMRRPDDRFASYPRRY